ncbi:MAG TPA: sulfatase-like hydrolase/transferase [Bacteroidales bacterium]|nr:sulfatase-like hydrolase/transferase [Bacteroidales bacterium]
MKKRILSLSFYAIFWLLFFVFARLFFILTHLHEASGEKLTGILGTFAHGIMLDISTTGYFLIIPFFIVLASIVIRGNWPAVVIRLYTFILIAFCSVITVADSSLYSYWGFRMDYTPFFYLRTPAEAVASVSALKLIVLSASIVMIAAAFMLLYARRCKNLFRGFEKTKFPAVQVFLFLVLTAALIIPIRGGFGIAPINAGTVYFSDRMFLNHTAINAVWNVGTSAVTQKPVENPYVFEKTELAKAEFDSIAFTRSGLPVRVLKVEKPNILMIVLESFSGYLFGPAGGDSLVTPCLNRLAHEGILFRNFYGSGTRTDKALPAILSGYPAQPAQSIIKEPKKSQTLPNLVRILIDKGYHSAFWYGGEINFANFNSYVVGSGFGTVVTKNYFNPKDFNSKWGVHDHVLFNALKDSLKAVREPFIDVVLTLSSHEPFEVPAEHRFSGNDVVTQYKNSVYYTDSVIGSFIDWAKGQDWWNNTLVVLVADHGARITGDIPAHSVDIFRIPMVWTGGALASGGLVVDKMGGQVDIAPTILGQMGIFDSVFPFSKDLLDKSSRSYAFYTYNEGFGFLTDSSYVAYDHKPGQFIVEEGKHPEVAARLGKAFLQVLFDDYLKR